MIPIRTGRSHASLPGLHACLAAEPLRLVWEAEVDAERRVDETSHTPDLVHVVERGDLGRIELHDLRVLLDSGVRHALGQDRMPLGDCESVSTWLFPSDSPDVP